MSGTGFAELHGALSVRGSRLVDESGSPVLLTGVSTHGAAWFPQYICRETFASLREDFGMNCVRLALYTHEYDGYCTGGDKARLKALVLHGAELAAEEGLYIIIDWHVLNEREPLVYADEAEEFFGDVSRRLSGAKNVIYEICNEPNTTADWEGISAYAERVVPVIRSSVPDSVILVGSPTWSQDIFCPLEKPLRFDNLMYTLHFYAATHGEWLRELTERCVGAGLPIFVSEFGLVEATGSGSINEREAAEWLGLLDRHGISRVCWNLSDNDESCALIKHGCRKLSGWTAEDLTEHGRHLLKRSCK